jgi:tetratricopeptide (TPR) repeat protein
MKLRAGFFRAVWIVALWVALSGCAPPGSGPLEEEKEPHFLAGKNRISTLDYEGAIKCFEKALQVNPQSASAHFELAWLYDEKEAEPAAAIYHYRHFLKLRPHADNVDTVNQRITSCKQALAQTVYLGPVTDKVQRQLEQVAEENKRLADENKRLHEELDRWTSYAARLQTLTNPAIAQAAAVQPRTEQSAQPVQRVAAPLPRPVTTSLVATMASSALAIRTHTVRTGDTVTLIAKKYGIKAEAILAANPGLEPRRLKVGQTLRIPGS